MHLVTTSSTPDDKPGPRWPSCIVVPKQQMFPIRE